MGYGKLLQQMISLAAVILLSVGCIAPLVTATPEASPSTPTLASSAVTPTPLIPTSTPLPSPTSTSLPGPKVGQWTGEPSVSFDLTSNGDITNFKIVIPSQMGDCQLEREKIVITAAHDDFQCVEGSTEFCDATTVEPDGTFIATALIQEKAFDKLLTATEEQKKWLKANNYWPTTVQTDVREMFEVTRLSGKFDGVTTLTGAYKIHLCQGNFIFGGEEGTWSAEWKQP